MLLVIVCVVLLLDNMLYMVIVFIVFDYIVYMCGGGEGFIWIFEVWEFILLLFILVNVSVYVVNILVFLMVVWLVGLVFWFCYFMESEDVKIGVLFVFKVIL